jgi:hypothetical protein
MTELYQFSVSILITSRISFLFTKQRWKTLYPTTRAVLMTSPVRTPDFPRRDVITIVVRDTFPQFTYLRSATVKNLVRVHLVLGSITWSFLDRSHSNLSLFTPNICRLLHTKRGCNIRTQYVLASS